MLGVVCGVCEGKGVLKSCMFMFLCGRMWVWLWHVEVARVQYVCVSVFWEMAVACEGDEGGGFNKCFYGPYTQIYMYPYLSLQFLDKDTKL